MYENMRGSFLQGLNRFYAEDVMPPRTSINMRRALMEHKKRLTAKGITYRETYTLCEEPREQEFSWKSKAFQSTEASAHYDAVTELSDGTTSLRCDDAKDDVAHLNILDRVGAVQEDASLRFICPNCGNQADADTFSDGCPMCGTKFKIDDLYPCVNAYYTRPYPLPPQTDNSTMKRATLAFYISCVPAVLGMIYTVYELVKHTRVNVIQLILMPIMNAIFGIMIFFLLIYAFLTVLFGILTVLGLFRVAADTLDMAGASMSKGRTEHAVRPFDPYFSYEVFEGKILSSFRTIAYSDNRKNCSLYCGQDDLSFMDDLVDIRYRGATKFISFEEKDNYLFLTMKVFLDNVYYKDGQFTRSRDTFDVELIRHKMVQTNPVFTVYSISCQKCGASFDAVQKNECPYCGTHNIISDMDWSIRSIVLLKQNEK